jgi:ATP-dependent RNA helicase HelY
VVWHNELDPDSLAGLASTRTYPLKSSFKPSYNMAINLIGKFGTQRARELLESSFAQFQADKSVVGLATQMRRNETAIDGYQEAMECHLGDFASYMNLRRQLTTLEKDTKRDGVRERRNNATNFLNDVERGDVIVVDSGRRSSTPYVVLDEARDADDPRPRVTSQSRVVKRIGYTDVGEIGRVIGRIRIPATFDSRSPKTRTWLADQIADISRSAPRVETSAQSETQADVEVSRLRKAIRAHACHGCNDREEHVRWHERIYTTQREIEKLESRVATRTSSIAKEFDQICDVLTELKYLEKQESSHIVTEAGAILGRIYCELDLLAAECLRSGVWKDLTAEQMASAVSTLVYESRRDDDRDTQNIPDGSLGIALTEMVYKWGELKEIETQHRMDSLRDMDPGFVWLTLKWARGQSIARVLKESDLQAGDFVRWSKQVIDLLGQISQASEDPEVARAARASSDLINRGIVAW